MGKFGLNSGYIGSDQISTEAGFVNYDKYYLERKLGNFNPVVDVLPVRSGLVLYLNASDINSYPGTGNTWYDISKTYTNNGILYNGVTFDSTNGKGLLFDGVDDKVYVPNNSSLNFLLTQQYTVISIIQPSGSGVTWHGIFSKGNSQQYALTINSPSAYYHYETNQSSIPALNSNTNTATFNQWQCMVARFNGTNKTIHKNDTIIATQNATTLSSTTNTEEFRIGEGNNSESYKGKIGVICVYNRALSTSELTLIYNSFKPLYNYA